MRGVRWLALATAVMACSSSEESSSVVSASGRTWQLTVLTQNGAPDDEIVAMVNERPVFGSCVKLQAEGHGLDRGAALQECIDFELLAQAADEAGTMLDPEVQRRGKQELVRAFVEARYDVRKPEDIPDDLVKRLWNRVKVPRFNHPELRDIVFCRIPLREDQQPGSKEFETALRFLQGVYEQLRDKSGLVKEDLYAPCYNEYKAAGVHELGLKTFRPLPIDEYLPEFRSAVFGPKEEGMVAPPLHTSYGLDLILVTRIIPEKVTTFEEAEPELREALFAKPVYESSRDALFETWYAPIAKRRQITVHYERIPESNPLAVGAPVSPGAPPQ